MDSHDLRGKPCPIPVIETKKLLARLKPGDCLQVLVDNDLARQNLYKMAGGLGHAVTHEATPEGDILVTFAVQALLPGLGPDGYPLEADQKTPGKLVVAIGSDRMGNGDDDNFSRTLLKSFISTLPELSPLPSAVLFYNSGIHLVCEGSAALVDLELLAAAGVGITACGACLNHYGKTERLRVGSIGNMLAIAQTLAEAGRILSP